ILGVLQADPAEWFSGVDEGLKAEVEGLLEQRAAARTAKNWAGADRIRDRLHELHVVVMDGPQGATWRMKGSGDVALPCMGRVVAQRAGGEGKVTLGSALE